MELEKKYIYQVYQCGSFSKAAEALFITQPALSIAIKKVEQEIGAAIFNRSQRPLTLTSIGELYLQHIKKEMLLEQQLKQQIDDIHGLKSGDLKIGGTHYMNAYLLPSYIAQFNTPTSTSPWPKQARICSLKCSRTTSLISPSAVTRT